MIKYLFIIGVVTLSNPWIYQITNFNFLVGLCIFILSILLTIYWQFRKSSYLALLLVLFIFLSSYLLIYRFDKNIFTVSALQKDMLATRQSYYAQEMGKLYGNRFMIYFFNQVKPYLDHLSQNLAKSLDILEFFSWNQKLNSGRFFIIFLPFFLIGILNLKKNWLIFSYLITTLVVSSLTKVGPLGPILLLPFINLATCIGFSKIFNIYKQKT